MAPSSPDLLNPSPTAPIVINLMSQEYTVVEGDSVLEIGVSRTGFIDRNIPVNVVLLDAEGTSPSNDTIVGVDGSVGKQCIGSFPLGVLLLTLQSFGLMELLTCFPSCNLHWHRMAGSTVPCVHVRNHCTSLHGSNV